MILDEIFLVFITFVVLLAATFARPERLRAPRGHYFEGVRPNGETTIRRSPIGEYDNPRGAIGARIYCTGGATAIVVDERTVGCQRRFR